MKESNVISLADFKKEKELVTDKRLRADLVRDLLRRRHAGEQADDRRDNDRFKFPRGKHPVLIVDGVPFRVLDISRTGVKFVGANLATLNLAAMVSAKILFRGKCDLSVKAQVVRIVGDLIALRFDEPLNMPNFAGAV